MDTVSPQARSRMMSRVGRRDTKPEMVVRSLAHSLGLRFRLCDRNLPGSPDLVFRRHGVVLFVHGCFWHHHECPRGTIPQTRPEYWLAKFARNRARDRRNKAELRHAGWKVIEVWECETRDLPRLSRRLRRIFRNTDGL
ncbi:very short patch repair endonuclease [Variovorax sp.]|uniref:very short patch repair endonuclease n=1 Tax=Variovorax TaxID=34072 RepID=UPI0009E67C0E|nr:very short patch repair endonuclease [Variovorax sp.]MBS77025.1 very short patch repair endonuclease [Variovorax sp.]